MCRATRTIAAALLLLLFAALGPSLHAEPRRVLLFHSFGQHFHPWSAVAARFREDLIRSSPVPIDLYEASLEAARLVPEQGDVATIEYLRALFASGKLDLVVAMGAPAARFFQRYREQFFPSTALLIAGADQRTINEELLTGNDTTVASTLDLPKLMENILQLLPDTKRVLIVIGGSRLEQYWVAQMRQAFTPFTPRVQFEWSNELSTDEMLKSAARLPARSAIFYASLRVDSRGVPNEYDAMLGRLRERASAPIFSYLDTTLGHGVVGGPVIDTQAIGRKAAEVAVRILGGEPPGQIKTPPVGLGAPTYDWRELERWGISEARLPPGSIVQFRERSLWERYRFQLTGVLAALLLQSGMIGWLLFERHRRRAAQLEAERRLSQVIHLNRSAELGALSASFAHELNQPLGAIVVNADLLEQAVSQEMPRNGRVRAWVNDIREAAEDAVEVMRHLRQLMQSTSDANMEELDVGAVIAEIIDIVTPEATRRGVSLRVSGAREPVQVRLMRIHLQQVMLNLLNNAMDAMAVSGCRLLEIDIRQRGASLVEVSVADTGCGIPADKLGTVFDTFYTTKEHGTGLGLSIVHTIIEAYGGTIWAENRPHGGAVFRFTLPVAGHSAGRRSVPALEKRTNGAQARGVG